MSTENTSVAAVSLPRRADDNSKATKPPVWPITDSVTTEPPPLSSQCDRVSRADGVCCKELKQEERTLIDPDVVRDVIIGLSDGLTVPFALTAGLSSLGTSRLVVLGGVAELIAGAISMGIGGFLASQAERDHFRFLRKQTSARVTLSCSGEMEREVEEILGPLGVDEKACRIVAESLRKAGTENANHTEAHKLRWSNDVGLTAFLLKFGEGMEEVPTKRLYISAFTIGMGYLLGGLIPLLPYFFIDQAHVALIYSCIVTGVVLLIFGAIKAQVTGASAGMGGIIRGAVTTLLVGGIAAASAFGIVRALEGGAD
ncbi:VIT family-domain-containing protein [Rhodocollybia butyracea]|uniref:VIT family-domain-containing protein n=1 Tax=Rhodocollybia butyracea TaxID=206335 RepID=A0A9P5QCM8_9AGAR|nr:VIT family-domain-containing protein [Rhodocollybia butyracea]